MKLRCLPAGLGEPAGASHWMCFSALNVRMCKVFSLEMFAFTQTFVKATPQAAFVILLNVSKHLLSLL